MKKSILILSAILSANVWAGASYIDLTGDYRQVFTTPSGNVLCGGDSVKNPQAKKYANDLYCFVYETKNLPKSCQRLPNKVGLNLMLKQKGKAKMSCAEFEFEPWNEGAEQTRTLKYGETVRGKGWVCKSETTGLRCQNDNGHGFEVNRSRYKMF